MTWFTAQNLAQPDSPKKTLDEFELISAIRQTLGKHQLSPLAPAPAPAPAPASAPASAPATASAAAPPSALTLEIDSGDDAAVIATNSARSLVWSVDSFTQDVHFRTRWVSAFNLGRRVVVASSADVVAMGASPNFALITLACPPELEQDWVLELADGIGAQSKALGMRVVGGDVSRARELHITASVLGVLPEGKAPVTRSGANPGDIVALYGQLGLAAAGLAVSESALSASSYQSLRDAYAYPAFDATIGAKASAAGASSMIDVSDGLVADLGHIAKASKAIIDIDSHRLRLNPDLVQAASELSLDPTKLVLTGGDDHAIVATFPAQAPLPEGFEVVGSVRGSSHEGAGEVRVDGATFNQVGGYRHF